MSLIPQYNMRMQLKVPADQEAKRNKVKIGEGKNVNSVYSCKLQEYFLDPFKNH